MRLLTQPTMTGAPQRIAPPARVLDDATREMLEDAEARGYERGRADGRQEATDAHAAAAERAAAAAAAALTAAREELLRLEEQYGGAVLGLAERVATAILGAEPHAGGRALLERVEQALAALDHGPFVLSVSPGDHAFVTAAAPTLPAGSEIVADASLQPGEARIRGAWSEADLTRDTVVSVLAAADVDRFGGEAVRTDATEVAP